MVFDAYARYYDLLYSDKNYESEAKYISLLLERYNITKGGDILELGCGTGRHAELLTKNGYSVTGLDYSESMLMEAKKDA